VQTPLQAVDLKELKRSLEDELERLKVLSLKIERAMESARFSEMIEKARRNQMDSDWLKELREQYTDETCQSTLQANGLFPVAQE
jgi:DnaJ-domain-containing protein 1